MCSNEYEFSTVEEFVSYLEEQGYPKEHINTEYSHIANSKNFETISPPVE
jgi:hypothetical protein